MTNRKRTFSEYAAGAANAASNARSLPRGHQKIDRDTASATAKGAKNVANEDTLAGQTPPVHGVTSPRRNQIKHSMLQTLQSRLGMMSLSSSSSSNKLWRAYHFSSLGRGTTKHHNIDAIKTGARLKYVDDTTPKLEPDQQAELLAQLSQTNLLESEVLYDDIKHAIRVLRPSKFQAKIQTTTLLEGAEDPEPSSIEDPGSSHTVDDAVEEFMQLQRDTNDCSACPPSWDECVSLLDLKVVPLDKVDPLTGVAFNITFEGLKLLPWQPQGVAFIHEMINGPVKGCIYSDATGLGKTVTLLCAMVRQARTIQDRIAKGRTLRKHKPSLIVCPLSAMAAWQDDAHERFGDPESSRHIKMVTLSSLGAQTGSAEQAKALQEFCDGLDPKAIQTSRTCVLLTYQAYRRLRLGHGKRKHSSTSVDGSIRAATFAGLYIDEAHHVKHPTSQQTQVLYELNPAYTILCTATPCSSSAVDFYGLLRFLGKRHVSSFARIRETQPVPTRDDFVRMENEFEQVYGRRLAAVPRNLVLDRYLSALEPTNFKRLLKSRNGIVEISQGEKVLRLPLLLLHLRRVMGEKLMINGTEVVLGTQIPHFQITWVELRLTRAQEQFYIECHDSTFNVEEYHGKRSAKRRQRHIRRRMTQASCSPTNDRFTQRNPDNDTLSVGQLLAGGMDVYTVYHTWVKGDIHDMPHVTRAQMAKYLTAMSPKLKAVARELQRIVIEKRSKLIIFCSWPLTQIFGVELLLDILEINFMSIRGGVPAIERHEAARRFNNDDAVRVLVCSSRCASESLNLQKGGHHILIVDVLPFPAILQVVGRVFRVGQTAQQEIRVLTTDGTYDQRVQALYVARYAVDVAARSNLVIPDEIRQRIAQRVFREDAEQIVREAQVHGIICELFGLRCSRGSQWSKTRNPKIKNLEPSEKLWRLVQGGDIATDMLLDLHESGSFADLAVEPSETSDNEEPGFEPIRNASYSDETDVGETDDSAVDDSSDDDLDSDIATVRHKIHRNKGCEKPWEEAYELRKDRVFEEAVYVREIEQAAKELAATELYQIIGYSVLDCLIAARAWAEGSPTLELAITARTTRMASEMPQDQAAQLRRAILVESSEAEEE